MSADTFEIKKIRGCLCVRFPTDSELGEYHVDFTDPTLLYRIHKGGGRKQAIAKAIGLKKGHPVPTVLDHTAGFGRDAFVLASLGCRVQMVERHPVVASCRHVLYAQ